MCIVYSSSETTEHTYNDRQESTSLWAENSLKAERLMSKEAETFVINNFPLSFLFSFILSKEESVEK